MSDSQAVEKVVEMVGSGVIIGEILCLFLLPKLPIFIAPLSFYPLHGRVTRKSRKQANRDAKSGIVRHDNNYYLEIPNPLLFQVETH